MPVPPGTGMRCTKTATVPVTFQGTLWGLASLVPPIISPHRDDGKLGQDDGPSDVSGYRGAINTKIRMTIIVPKSNKGLEPVPLASLSLLLHTHEF